MTLVIIGALIVGAVALGWWLLARKKDWWELYEEEQRKLFEDPHPVPDWPGFDSHKGVLVFTTYAKGRMRLRGVTEKDVRHVLANPAKEEPSDKPGQHDRMLREGVDSAGRYLRVITRDRKKGGFHVINVIWKEAWSPVMRNS
jgi:hypothetical protein